MQFQRTSGTHANDTIKPVPVPHTLENRKINYRAGQTRVTRERGELGACISKLRQASVDTNLSIFIYDKHTHQEQAMTRFLARDAMLARYLLSSSVRMVCPSATSRYCTSKRLDGSSCWLGIHLSYIIF